MPHLFKTGLSVLLSFVMIFSAVGQDLDYLPPVLTTRLNKDSCTSLLINTLDFARAEHQAEKKPYVYSIQIIDAAEPWPPRWYTAKPVYTDEMFAKDKAAHIRHVDYIENPEINGNYIFYLQIFPLNKILDPTKTFDVQHSAHLAVLDTNLHLVDSIECGRLRGGQYGSGYYNNNQIENLTILRRDTIMDWRKVSGKDCDSTIDNEFGLIRILDTRNNVTWSWNPLEHVNLNLLQAEEKLSQLPYPPDPGELRDIRWLKISSVGWDHDGDILYGIENVGIGKISRKDGHIIWQINYSEPYVQGHDTISCYSPYDFKLIYDDVIRSVYSFYERGISEKLNARGVVFEQNKKTQKLKLVRYITPKVNYSSNGHGGFDYDYLSGNFTLDYGVFEHTDTGASGFWTAFEYGRNDTTYAIYRIPKWNYPFGVHRLENFPSPPRPTIVQHGTMLEASVATNKSTWYKLEGKGNTTITQVGTGSAFKCEKKTTYCVACPYGAGYTVSRPYTTK
jgi:hypothetical protein